MPDPTSPAVAELLARNAELEKENALLRQKIDLLIRKVFGASSEKLDPAQLQLLLQGMEPPPPGKSPEPVAVEEPRRSMVPSPPRERNAAAELIEFAKREVDHLFVLVCWRDSDPIPGAVRLNWLKKVAHGAEVVDLQLNDSSVPKTGSDIYLEWSVNIRRAICRQINYVFSRESYGPSLARHLDAIHIHVKPDPETPHISGTKIRASSQANLLCVPELVRDYLRNVFGK